MLNAARVEVFFSFFIFCLNQWCVALKKIIDNMLEWIYADNYSVSVSERISFPAKSKTQWNEISSSYLNVFFCFCFFVLLLLPLKMEMKVVRKSRGSREKIKICNSLWGQIPLVLSFGRAVQELISVCTEVIIWMSFHSLLHGMVEMNRHFFLRKGKDCNP